MEKITLRISLALILIFLAINIVSASSYYYPSQTYYYPSSSQYTKYPTYYNAPTIIDKTSSLNQDTLTYSKSYQGPIIQKDTKYDEFLKIGKSGRVTRTISAQTSERYVGAVQLENKDSKTLSSYNQDYNYIPNNPTYYDGGYSSFRYTPTYNYNNYGPDSYLNNYYYSPRYNSQGYYNWRY